MIYKAYITSNNYFQFIVFWCLLPLILITLSSCNDDPVIEKKNVNPNQLKEPFIEANKKVVKTESQHIIDFLQRYQWPVKETGSGLRYYIYHEGDGIKAKKGNIATINYSIKLISGDEIYNSQTKGPMIFNIGQGDVASGLEEGILFLSIGDKAKFIIPSHLGFGLLGDQDKVPPKATLIYDVQLVNLE